MWWRKHWISPWPVVAKVIVTATVSRHTTTWSVKLRRAVLKVIFGKTVPRTPSHCGLVNHVVHRTVHRIVYFLKCDVKNLNKIWIWIVNKQTNKHKNKTTFEKRLQIYRDTRVHVSRVLVHVCLCTRVSSIYTNFQYNF